MPATIYVSKASLDTMTLIAPLDYYDRCTLSDVPETDPTGRPGYYLKNLSHLAVSVLPEGAHIALHLDAGDSAVSFPAELRGCIFEHASCLPPDYHAIISYWSGTPINSNAGGSAYYQCPAQAYTVSLDALDADPDLINRRISTPLIDALISEGIVVSIVGLNSKLANASDDDFISIALPIDNDLVCLDNGGFLTNQPYRTDTTRAEHIFLKVADVRLSPNPGRIYIDILRYEELDYGMYY
jgi:hypothetical protein